MILWASKRGMGKWKLTEVEKQIFDEDCRGDCMHKWGCEN